MKPSRDVHSITDLKVSPSTLVDGAEERGPQIITRNGRAAAVLLSVEQYEELEELAHQARVRRFLAEGEAEIADGKAVPWEEVSKLLLAAVEGT